MSIDGSNQVNLTNNPAFDIDPAYSPDGNTIVFASQRDCPSFENSKLYVMKSDGTNISPLPVGFSIAPDSSLFCEPFVLRAPKYSPDGGKIAFNGNVVPGGPSLGNTQIYIMNSDGTNPKNISNNLFNEIDPVFTPDGQRIVFSSNQSGNFDVYIMKVDGTSRVQLTNTPGDDVVPEISADGSKITFTAGRDGNFQVYVMNIDGSNQTNLTRNSSDNGDSVFAPDGRKIAFASNRDGNLEIYIMNADGTNQVRLTNNSTSDIQPFFKP